RRVQRHAHEPGPPGDRPASEQHERDRQHQQTAQPDERRAAQTALLQQQVPHRMTAGGGRQQAESDHVDSVYMMSIDGVYSLPVDRLKKASGSWSGRLGLETIGDMTEISERAVVRRLNDRLGFGPAPGDLEAGVDATVRRLLGPAKDAAAAAIPV